MRIAIANDQGKRIAAHTGRCPRFLIYDVNDEEVTELRQRDNPMALNQCGDHSHEQHAHSNHSHDALLAALGDCQVLICRGMGPRLRSDLAAIGITPLICGEDSAEQALELFRAGELKSVKAAHCHHG